MALRGGDAAAWGEHVKKEEKFLDLWADRAKTGPANGGPHPAQAATRTPSSCSTKAWSCSGAASRHGHSSRNKAFTGGADSFWLSSGDSLPKAKSPIDPVMYIYDAPYAACTVTAPMQSLHRDTFRGPKLSGSPLNKSWSSVNLVEQQRSKPVARAPIPFASSTGVKNLQTLHQESFRPRTGEVEALNQVPPPRSGLGRSQSSIGAPYMDLLAADGRSSTLARARGVGGLSTTQGSAFSAMRMSQTVHF